MVVKLDLTHYERAALVQAVPKVLRKLSGTKRDEITELMENRECYVMLSYMRCILHLTKSGILNRDD